MEAQARAFARSLLENGDIGTTGRATRRAGFAPQPSVDRGVRKPTHAIKIKGGQPELVRIGFR